MDDRHEKRWILRDIMDMCQNRYRLPELANEYQNLFELAKKLYSSVNLTDFKYEKRFVEVTTRYEELENLARPLTAAAEKPVQLPKKKRGGKRDGAGRPGKGYERRKPTLSLPPEYWQMFDALAERTQTEQAALIRGMMISVLDGLSVHGAFEDVDEIACPVCSGAGTIQPKALPAAIVCPGCNGAKQLQQIKL